MMTIKFQIGGVLCEMYAKEVEAATCYFCLFITVYSFLIIPTFLYTAKNNIMRIAKFLLWLEELILNTYYIKKANSLY